MIETAHGHIPYFPTPVPGLNPSSDPTVIQKKSDDPNYLFDLFSLIAIPVGIARSVGYLADRTIVASLVLIALPRTLIGSVFAWFVEPDQISTSVDVCDWVNKYVRGVEARPLTYTTDDGALVDSISYYSDFQRTTSTYEQKWIVSCEPNAVYIQDRHEDYAVKSARIGVNILTMNYRGVGPLGGPWARSFNDLVEDVDAGVRHLIARGVSERNIVVEGLSLGGAVATQVAARHQEPGREVSLLAQNTFSAISNEASAYVKGIFAGLWEAKLNIDENTYQMDMSPIGRIILLLFDSIASLVEIGVYVSYFALSFIENFITLHPTDAIYDLWSMAKVIVLDPIISLLSITGFALSVIELVPILIVGQDWTPLLSARIHILTRTLNNYIAGSEEESLALKIANSTRLEYIVKSVIGQSRWETDVIGAYMSLKGHRLISYCPDDSVIPYKASLAKAFRERTETKFPKEVECMGEKTSHCDLLEDAHEEVYIDFLEKAFGVKFTYPLAPKLSTDNGWGPVRRLDLDLQPPDPMIPEEPAPPVQPLPFQLTVSPQHAGIISEIITTVGNSYTVSLGLKVNQLQLLGQQLNGHVNSLQYLGYIFSSPHLKQPMRAIYDNPLKWNPSVTALAVDLNNKSNDGRLQTMLPHFALKTGCDLDLLREKVRVRDWHGFCEALVMTHR